MKETRRLQRRDVCCCSSRTMPLQGGPPPLLLLLLCSSAELHTPSRSFKRRKKKSIMVTVMLLIVSILILIFGLAATTRTQNITVGGYYPGAIDLRPLYAGRCDYHSSDTSSERDVPCQTSSRMPCHLKVKSNTCYCCDLYNCGNRVEVIGGYHEYIDVKSCQDVVHLYHLLWSATILNIVALFLGIITAAPPATNSQLSSYYNTAPCLPPYTAYDLQGSSTFPDSSGMSDESQSGASHMWPAMVPPRYSPPHFPPDEKPPPYSP
ncbi:hypothetical protein CRUP_025873 [Coryphaenoides rupestris]|nr:hypothetical protein CRUP_025873 [Coryphaenoides rupestris]